MNGLLRLHEHPKHYCGVFGVYGHPDAAELTYYGLYQLQHRGQESAGIVTTDGSRFHAHRGMGLVPSVFTGSALRNLPGHAAIGHTRYSTTGSSNLVNAQPLLVDCARGRIAIGHNGNLTNAAALRAELEARGSIFQTTTDSEIIVHLLAQPTPPGGHESVLVEAVRRVEGAFSLVILSENALIGVRDPFGFRPLSLGRLENGAYVLASETCAFDLIHATFVRDLEPGEILWIDDKGPRSLQSCPDHRERAFCIFEYVYFARPDSILAGRSVYGARVEMGRQLAREHPVDADIVVPVPDSGNCAALGYSLESGIPYEMAFVRNHYVGRSFLQPSQLIRDFSVRVKLNLVGELVKNRRVVVIDDSIVRGTTSRARVASLKEAGAQAVHLRVSCPPHLHPCRYGIDFPDRDKLLAANYSHDEIRSFLNADSLGYLSLEGMIAATGKPSDGFCLACYTGEYPTKFDPAADKHIMEHRRGRTRGLGEGLDAEAQHRRLF